VSRDDVALSLYAAKQPPFPCTWLSHAQSTMKLSDCLCAFNTSSLFQLVSIYLLECLLFLTPSWVGITPTRPGLFTRTFPKCAFLQAEHKGSPRFRYVPFDTVPLSMTPEECNCPRLLRTIACCLPAMPYCRPPQRQHFRGLLHSLALRPGNSRTPASSALLPPLMRFKLRAAGYALPVWDSNPLERTSFAWRTACLFHVLQVCLFHFFISVRLCGRLR